MIPFTAPTSYSAMLNKIAIFTFFVSLFLIYVLSSASTNISDFLTQFNLRVEVANMNMPVAYVVLALLITLFARIIKLHDKISTLFRIRQNIDIYHILVPLAGGVGIPTNSEVLEQFKANRHDWMRKVFYRYASSSKPAIDAHDITMALDKLTWFWIIIELLAVGILALIILTGLGAFASAAWLAIVLFICLFLTFPMYAACARAAKIEVKAILEDPARKDQIRGSFNAL